MGFDSYSSAVAVDRGKDVLAGIFAFVVVVVVVAELVLPLQPGALQDRIE